MPDAQKPDSNALSRAASLKTFDDAERTVDVTFATATRVLRESYIGRFYEELVISRSACDLKRLNTGAPFLNAHGGSYDARSVMAAVVPGSAKIEGDAGVARIRFDSAENDPDAEKVFQKIKAQILTGVSVGYRVLEMKKSKEEVDGIPVYRVTKWEPYEISVAPIPADIESKFRSLIMPEENEVQFSAPETRTAPAAAPAPVASPAVAVPAVNLEAERAAAVSTERQRIAEISALVRTAKVDPKIGDELVASGASLEAARAKILDAMIAKDEASNVPRGGAVGTDIGADAARTGMAEALLHRFDPTKNSLTDNGRRFRGLTLLEIGERGLELKGARRQEGLTKMQRAAMVLGLERSEHSTSDFPLILADAAGKVLRDAYAMRPSTFTAFSRRVNLPDFRDRKVTQISDAPALLPLLEGGEIRSGTLTEGREIWRLSTYARKVAVTRQVIINDDLDAFMRLAQLFGRSAVEVQSATFYAHLVSNPTMGDAVTLFHASRGNSGTGVYSQTTISNARTYFRKAKGPGADGLYLNLEPKYAVIPAEIETTFDRENALINPSQSSTVNPFSGRLEKLVEGRLSALPFYFVADPAMVDTAEYGFLDGEDGPAIESRNGWEIEGVEIKCRLDFGCKIIEPRAFYYSTGA